MRVDVVHAGAVPSVAANRSEHGRFREFVLFVSGRGQVSNGKGANLLAVNGNTVLGKAKRLVIVDQYSSSGTRDAFVAGDQRARGVLGPGGDGIGSEIEAQRIMLVRGGAGEEPPFSIEKEDGRIGLDAGNDVLDANPLVRKRGGPIKADSAGAERLGDHIEVTVPAKDIRIGKMKRLAQDDLPVLPSETVAAHGEAYFAQIVAAVHHLEKHVPEAIHVKHEWIGDEVRGYVSDVA